MQIPRQPLPILVALNKSNISRTKKLCGIFKAFSESRQFGLKIMDEGRDLTPDYVDREIAGGIKGFLVGATGVSAAIDHIGKLGLPLATISLPHKTFRNACSIHTDNTDIAKEAVRILTSSKTVNAFAYYPPVDAPEWSREREAQFLRLTANRRGAPSVTLPRNGTAEALTALPRPVGILAANDTYAMELLDICHRANLRIPSDVSIIGVDNEEILCENATPSLSSIEPDFEREGYEAAKALIQLLKRKPVPPRIVCGIKRIVSRKSTVDKNYADALVTRALEYINEKATSGITVSDVCSYLHVSQRLLGLRFHEIKKYSPIDAIINRKLTALRKELAATDLPIALVCRRCGFGSENHPKKLFRKRYDMTMKDYRAAKRVRRP